MWQLTGHVTRSMSHLGHQPRPTGAIDVSRPRQDRPLLQVEFLLSVLPELQTSESRSGTSTSGWPIQGQVPTFGLLGNNALARQGVGILSSGWRENISTVEAGFDPGEKTQA